MTPFEKNFSKHKKKSIESYLSWEKCMLIDIKEPIIARQCAEHILKALVISQTRLNIIQFDNSTLKKLQNNGDIPLAIKTFGGNACLHLIKVKCPNLLSEESILDFTSIIDLGNKSGHDTDETDDTKINKIKQSLFNIADWFFGVIEKEPNWKQNVDKQIENIKQISNKEIAIQIAQHLKEYLTEIRDKESLVDDERIVISQIKDAISLLNNFSDDLVEKHSIAVKKIVKESETSIIKAIKDNSKDIPNKRAIKKYIVLIVFVLFVFTLIVNNYKTQQIQATSADKNNSPKNDLFNSVQNYNILVLPFRNPENGKFSTAGDELTKLLKQKNNLNKLGLDIKYLQLDTNNEITPEFARNIGKQIKGTDMVIWGNDSKPEGNASHQIYFHYANLTTDKGKAKIPQDDKTEMLEIYRLVEIAEGNLHLEINDVIYWFLGSKYYLKENYDKALQCFQKIENRKYLNEDVYLNMSSCFFYKGFFDEAKKCTQKALEISPFCAKAHFCYGALLAGKFNKYDSAKIEFEKGLRINPLCAEAHFAYGVLLAEEFNNRDSAKVEYEKALRINPGMADVHFFYAGLLKNKFYDLDGAVKQYEILFQIDQNNHFKAEAHSNYAMILYKNYDIEGAKKHCLEALKIDPSSASLHYNYGLILSELKYKDSAKVEYEKALRINPSFADAHFNYANLLVWDFNNLDSANVHYEKTFKIDTLYAEAYFNYASNLMLKKEINMAKKYYLKAVRLKPELKTKERDHSFGIK